MGRLRFVILTLWLALWPYLVTAQVAMEVQLGLQGTVRLEKWNLVTVSLHNTGPPLVGTLGVRVWRGSDFRKDRHVTTYTQLAELPYRSRKRFTFAVPITSTTHPVEVFLHQGEQRLAHQQLNLREALNAEHLILGLTRDLGLDFLAKLLHPLVDDSQVATCLADSLLKAISMPDRQTAVGVIQGQV